MQRLGGLLLIVAGVSLGAYTFLPAPFDSERTLRDVTRISAAPDRLSQSGRSSWIDGDEVVTGSVSERVAETGVQGDAKTDASVAAPAPGMAPSDRPAVAWSAIVTADQSQQARITSSKPADSETRIQLTRDLQSELKRVGCYGGDVNGAWTASTKKAMSAFMDRVNATLPVNEPDYILLTLVQGHAAKACGIACPTGQTAGGDGRCVPQAVIAARAAKKAKQETASRDSRAVRADVVADTTNTREPAPARAATTRDRNQDRVAVAAAAPVQEQLPWLDNDDLSKPASTPPAPRTIRRPDGMMSVGAAQIARAELDERPAASITSPVLETPEPRRPTPPATSFKSERAAPKFSAPGAADQRGLPGTKSGPSVYRPKQASKPKRIKPALAAVRRPSAYVIAPKIKPKYYSSYGGRRLARPGSPAYNMLQAMGGVW